MVGYRKKIIILALLSLTGCTGRHLILDGNCVTCFNSNQAETVVDVKEESVINKLGAEGKVIDATNFYYFYASMSKEGVGVEKLAAIYYNRYRQTRNEFEAKKVLESLKVGIQEKLDIANSSPSVFVPVQATLGSYDFNKEGFNLNLSPRYSFDYRNYNWNLAFPAKVHTMVSMDEGRGNRYLKRFPTRHVNVLVESSMSSAKQGTLYANPIKLHVLNPDGELLKTINL